MIEYSFRPATGADVAKVAELVNAAYGHYVERLGMLPRPMTDDYAEVIANQRVTVAESHGNIMGVIVLTVDDEGFLIDNVAVAPSHRGEGIGRALLEFAEAEAHRMGFDSIHLYTHEKMTENLAMYARIGYVEYDRRSHGEFFLVYMTKHLAEVAVRFHAVPQGILWIDSTEQAWRQTTLNDCRSSVFAMATAIGAVFAWVW